MKYKLIILAAALALAGCKKENPDLVAAQDLYQRAIAAYDNGDAMLAKSLLDSIDQKYPAQLEVRRKATVLRPQAIEKVTIQQISSTDSMLAQAQLDIAELEPLMKHIPGGDLEGYYVVADAYNPAFINHSGIEGRVNDANLLYYIVAQNKGKAIGINAIQLSGNDSACRSLPIPEGSARVDVVEGGEIASFLPEEVDTIGQWASVNKVVGAKLVGSKGNANIKLNDKQAAALGTAWKFANAKGRERQARILREKLERQLQIARDQIAKTSAQNPG